MQHEGWSLEYHTRHFNHIQWLSQSLTLCVIIPALGFYNTPWHDCVPPYFLCLQFKLMHRAYGAICCNGRAARLCLVMPLNPFCQVSPSTLICVAENDACVKARSRVETPKLHQLERRLLVVTKPQRMRVLQHIYLWLSLAALHNRNSLFSPNKLW